MSLSRGSSSAMFLRLCSRAPRTTSESDTATRLAAATPARTDVRHESASQCRSSGTPTTSSGRRRQARSATVDALGALGGSSSDARTARRPAASTTATAHSRSSSDGASSQRRSTYGVAALADEEAVPGDDRRPRAGRTSASTASVDACDRSDSQAAGERVDGARRPPSTDAGAPVGERCERRHAERHERRAEPQRGSGRAHCGAAPPGYWTATTSGDGTDGDRERDRAVRGRRTPAPATRERRGREQPGTNPRPPRARRAGARHDRRGQRRRRAAGRLVGRRRRRPATTATHEPPSTTLGRRRRAASASSGDDASASRRSPRSADRRPRRRADATPRGASPADRPRARRWRPADRDADHRSAPGDRGRRPPASPDASDQPSAADRDERVHERLGPHGRGQHRAARRRRAAPADGGSPSTTPASSATAHDHAGDAERVLPEVEGVDRDRRGQADDPERLPAGASAPDAPRRATGPRTPRRPRRASAAAGQPVAAERPERPASSSIGSVVTCTQSPSTRRAS